MGDIINLDDFSLSTAQKNKTAAINGIILGIIYLIFTSIANAMVSNLIVFYAAKFIAYVLFFVIIGIMVTRIKKANGGYIEFKDVFGKIFVIILVSEIIYYIYMFIFYKYIDPAFMDKVKVSTVHFMEQMKMTDDKIEQATAGLDKTIADSKKFNLGNNILSFFGTLVVDSLFGLIVAAIVKKPKPVVY